MGIHPFLLNLHGLIVLPTVYKIDLQQKQKLRKSTLFLNTYIDHSSFFSSNLSTTPSPVDGKQRRWLEKIFRLLR